MAIILENIPQKATVVFTKNGQPGTVDGAPVWDMVPPDAALMTVAADGMSVDISWVKEGTATLTVKGDSDLTEGVVDVIATADLVFPASTVGADAATIQFTNV
jgi:hypothetical protein